MKGLWHTLAPFATDVSGACTVFQHSSALVIAQDSNGAVSNLRRVVDVNEATANFETIDLPEVAYTLGREEEFQERMRELFELDDRTIMLFDPRVREPYELVVLANGPVPNLLGTDLAHRAHLFEETCGLPTLYVQTTGNKYYDAGITAAYDAIYERFVKPVADNPLPLVQRPGVQEENRDERYVNVLGFTELDWPQEAAYERLREAMRDQKTRIVSNFGYHDMIASWQRSPHAELNIVASAGAVKLARKMHRELGIPYRMLDELDCFDVWAEGLHLDKEPRVLIVGELVSSRVLRRLLKILGAGDVHIATFFSVDRTLREDSVSRLTGESDLRKLLASDTYDLVIGDGIFEEMCSTPYFALMHPPVGFGERDDTELSRPWLEELCAWWNRGAVFMEDELVVPTPKADDRDFSL